MQAPRLPAATPRISSLDVRISNIIVQEQDNSVADLHSVYCLHLLQKALLSEGTLDTCPARIRGKAGKNKGIWEKQTDLYDAHEEEEKRLCHSGLGSRASINLKPGKI